jgi:hypothetical protein
MGMKQLRAEFITIHTVRRRIRFDRQEAGIDFITWGYYSQ